MDSVPLLVGALCLLALVAIYYVFLRKPADEAAPAEKQ